MKQQPQKIHQGVEFWQCGVAFNLDITERISLFKSVKKNIAIPFFSTQIFTDKESAAYFFPKFIQELIQDGSLPAEVIVNNTIDENLIKTFIRAVTVVAISVENVNNMIPE